MSIVEKTSKYQ